MNGWDDIGLTLRNETEDFRFRDARQNAKAPWL